MGYLVRKLSYKNRSWKVQFDQFINGKRRAVDLKEEDYVRLGLHYKMTVEEAKSVCKQLNSQLHLKRIEQKRIKISKRLDEETIKINSHFSEIHLTEFESMYISKVNKFEMHWRTAKKIIVELGIDPSDWCFYKDRFYEYFRTKNYSDSYAQKLISALNRWGKYISYKKKSYFEELPFLGGRERQKVIDNYYMNKKSKASISLLPELLESNKSKLKEANYNWLYLSVWLGLRPSEVDNLQKEPGEMTWYFRDGVMWVYQTKLTGISRDKRLKPIPLKYPEQRACIEIIQSKNFKRPLVKVIRNHLGDSLTCYGGRKGFTDLMLSRGNSLEAISQWLGHTTIDRTWKTYKNKKQVLI